MAYKRLIQTSSISSPDPRFWGFGGSRYSKDLSKIFSIGLYDLREHSFIFHTEPLNGKQATKPVYWALYYFTTPPQSYEMSEPASVNVVPTQDGGKFVESQGSIFKDIRLSGTVGFRPNPVSNELFPGLEAAGGPSLTIPSVLNQTDDRGLNPKEVTGFDELIYLRNIFRAYWDLKTNSKWAKRIVMIFMYSKECELYIVEPINFTTTRDKSSPLSWRYNITLRTMYKWDDLISYTKDSLNVFQSVTNVASMIRKVSRDISRSLHEMAANITYFANLPANKLNKILSIGLDVMKGIAAVKNAGSSFSETMTKTMLNTWRSNGEEVLRLFDEKYSPNNPNFVTSGDINSDQASLMAGDVGVSRHAVRTLVRSAETLLSMDSLWEGSKQVQIEDYSKAYYDQYGEPPYNTGSPLNLENISLPESATEVDVTGVADIRSLAMEHLGDEAKWKTLVILNNLKPPYISSVRGDGVLAPGDKILIPKDQTLENTSGVSNTTNTDQNMVNQSVMTRKYGRDLVISDGGSGLSSADLTVNQTGGLSFIEGVSNVEQAMKIKFSVEQGELPVHPDFGAKYPVGTKITLVKIQEFLISTRKTFLSDPRVESILSTRVAAEGDKIFTSSKLKLTGTDQQLPITFAVRR